MDTLQCFTFWNVNTLWSREGVLYVQQAERRRHKGCTSNSPSVVWPCMSERLKRKSSAEQPSTSRAAATRTTHIHPRFLPTTRQDGQHSQRSFLGQALSTRTNSSLSLLTTNSCHRAEVWGRQAEERSQSQKQQLDGNCLIKTRGKEAKERLLPPGPKRNSKVGGAP